MSHINYNWIIDCVSSILSSPRWEAEVLSFVDEKCIIFDDEEENKFEFTAVHQEYLELVDVVLQERLKEYGIHEEEFCNACLMYHEQCKKQKSGNKKKKKTLDQSVIEQIFAMSDFQRFKAMMLKRNIELEIEAMEALNNNSVCCKQHIENHTFDKVQHKMENHDYSDKVLETSIVMDSHSITLVDNVSTAEKTFRDSDCTRNAKTNKTSSEGDNEELAFDNNNSIKTKNGCSRVDDQKVPPKEEEEEEEECIDDATTNSNSDYHHFNSKEGKPFQSKADTIVIKFEEGEYNAITTKLLYVESSDEVTSHHTREKVNVKVPMGTSESDFSSNSPISTYVVQAKTKEEKGTPTKQPAIIYVKDTKRSEAIVRHNKFIKAKLHKSLEQCKSAEDRTNREEHLKKQRDIIVLKRNEMRKKVAANDSRAIVSLHQHHNHYHHLPPMKIAPKQQLLKSTLSVKGGQKALLTSNMMYLLREI